MVVHSSNTMNYIKPIENVVRCKREKERETVAWNTEHSECQMLMKRVNRGQGTSIKDRTCSLDCSLPILPNVFRA